MQGSETTHDYVELLERLYDWPQHEPSDGLSRQT